jgi:hypothetical protein
MLTSPALVIAKSAVFKEERVHMRQGEAACSSQDPMLCGESGGLADE